MEKLCQDSQRRGRFWAGNLSNARASPFHRHHQIICCWFLIPPECQMLNRVRRHETLVKNGSYLWISKAGIHRSDWGKRQTEILNIWGWIQYAPPKRRYISTRLHVIKCQDTKLFNPWCVLNVQKSPLGWFYILKWVGLYLNNMHRKTAYIDI